MTSRRIKVLVPPPTAVPRGARAAAAAGLWVARALAWRPARTAGPVTGPGPGTPLPRLHPADPRS